MLLSFILSFNVAADVILPQVVYTINGSVWALSVSDEYISVASDNGFVYLLNKQGVTLWQLKLTDGITAVNLNDDVIAANTMDEKLYIINLSGQIKDYLKVTGYTEHSKALHVRGDNVVLGTRSGDVFFFEGGELMWNKKLDAYVIESIIDENLIKVVSDKRIYVFDYYGRTLLNKSFPSYIRSTSITPDYFSAGLGNNELYLVDNRGETIWSNQLRDQIGVIDISTHVVCGLRNGEVHVFDLAGREINVFNLNAPVVSISKLTNNILASTLNNRLYLLNIYGGVEWVQKTEGYVTTSHLSRDYLIAGSSLGELYYLRMFRNPQQVKLVTGFVILSLVIGLIILIISLRY